MSFNRQAGQSVDLQNDMNALMNEGGMKSNEIYKQGWLTKKGGSKGKWYEMTSWRKRWFVLSAARLCYYKTKAQFVEGNEPLGHMLIDANFKLVDAKDPKQKALFTIHSSNRDPMEVKAELEEGKHAWLGIQKIVESCRQELLSGGLPAAESKQLGDSKHAIAASSTVNDPAGPLTGLDSGSWKSRPDFVSRTSDGRAHFAIDLCHMINVADDQVKAGIQSVRALVTYLTKITAVQLAAEKQIQELNATLGEELSIQTKDQMKTYTLCIGNTTKLFKKGCSQRLQYIHQVTDKVIDPIDTWTISAEATRSRIMNREASHSKALTMKRTALLAQRVKCMNAWKHLANAHCALNTPSDKPKDMNKLKKEEEKWVEKAVKHFKRFKIAKNELLTLQGDYVNETLPFILHTMESLEGARLKTVKYRLNILADLDEQSRNAIEFSKRFKTQVAALNGMDTIQECIRRWCTTYGRPPNIVMPNFVLPCTLADLQNGDFKQQPLLKERVDSLLKGEGDVQEDEDEDANDDQKFSLMNVVRGLVSKKKKRFKEDGFDLDLTYITPTIIAMGFPAEGVAGQYRNNMTDVQRFLNTRHPRRYRIYNLCSELSYDHAKFENRVVRYGFNDHNPSPFLMMHDMVHDMHNWLQKHPKNIIAVHCKAGKGRTGFIISAYLVYASMCQNAPEAITFFGKARTYDGQGVTIPSQKRFVYYFEWWLKYKQRTAIVVLSLLRKDHSDMVFLPEEAVETATDTAAVADEAASETTTAAEQQQEPVEQPYLAQAQWTVKSLLNWLIAKKQYKPPQRADALQLVVIMKHFGYIENVDPKKKNTKLVDDDVLKFRFSAFKTTKLEPIENALTAMETNPEANAIADDDTKTDSSTVVAPVDVKDDGMNLSPTITDLLGLPKDWNRTTRHDLSLPLVKESVPLFLKSIVIHGIPFTIDTDTTVWFELYKPLEEKPFFSSAQRKPEFRIGEDYLMWTSGNAKAITKVLNGFRVQFKMMSKTTKTSKLCHFWLNSRFFLPDAREAGYYKIQLPKKWVDKARKDKHSKVFPEHFVITLVFGSPSTRTRLKLLNGTAPINPDTNRPDFDKLAEQLEQKDYKHSKKSSKVLTEPSALADEAAAADLEALEEGDQSTVESEAETLTPEPEADQPELAAVQEAAEEATEAEEEEPQALEEDSSEGDEAADVVVDLALSSAPKVVHSQNLGEVHQRKKTDSFSWKQNDGGDLVQFSSSDEDSSSDEEN